MWRLVAAIVIIVIRPSLDLTQQATSSSHACEVRPEFGVGYYEFAQFINAIHAEGLHLMVELTT